MSGMTASTLEDTLGKMVVVVLKDGRSLHGRMSGFDQYLNLLLDEAEDVTKPEAVKKLGSIILRGDTIVYILLMRS